MTAPYPIIQIQSDWIVGDEALGSKPKFWFRRDGEQWLFKEARDSTGEDWAEKIAAEVAHLLAVPAATVELAEYQDRRGCASRSFVNKANGENLIHGNEILAGTVIGYDPSKKFRQADHTLANINRAIRKLFQRPAEYGEVLTQLATYMVFDALIGNTDRHHENWGLLVRLEKVPDGSGRLHVQVAPTFDHASSLGRELRDERREALLHAGSVEKYLRNGHGGIYRLARDKRGENPLALVEYGVKSRKFQRHFFPALDRLLLVSNESLGAVVDRVPGARMSDPAKAFCKQFLAESRAALTNQRK